MKDVVRGRNPQTTRNHMRTAAKGKRRNWCFKVLALSCVLLAMLCTSGCGGSSQLNLALLRDVTEDQPAYVGVFYLSQESVLDAAQIPDLIDHPETFTEGVVDKEVFPVYPGTTKTLNQENFDPAISWVLIVADFPGGRECTRVKRAVPAGGKLDLTVHVEQNCLKAD